MNNSSLKKFLKEHNFKMIYGRSYNRHSQGNEDNFNLKETLITICDNYNSKTFSEHKDLFIKVKNNLEKNIVKKMHPFLKN